MFEHAVGRRFVLMERVVRILTEMLEKKS